MRLVPFFFVFIAIPFAVGLAPAAAAGGAAGAFDGRWEITLTCPPHHEDDDAKGYVHRFPAEIRDNVLRGVHGTEGPPSWHLLSGTIAPDGSASLRLDGIVNNPDYAVDSASRGKAYSERVQAVFLPDGGMGQRVGKRKCDFRFVRQ